MVDGNMDSREPSVEEKRMADDRNVLCTSSSEAERPTAGMGFSTMRGPKVPL